MKVIKRSDGFDDNAVSGFPAILATWENEGWVKLKLTENTVLSQVTLTLKTVTEMKEVLSAKDYEKLFSIIEYLESNEEITTQKAEELTGRSSATAWRYLKKLDDIGVVKADGNTSNVIYKHC